MFKKCVPTLVGVLLVFISICGSMNAIAYPTNGNNPRTAPADYAKLRAEKAVMSIGEVRFVTQHPAQLTLAERFVLFGCDPSSSSKAHRSMISELFITLSNYHLATGRIPTEITDEVIEEACAAVGQAPRAELYDLLKSPLTGRYPKLNCSDFSRGDFFIKVLTTAEINHVARHNGSLKARLRQASDGSGSTNTALGPIFYFRSYGESEVIFADLKYAWY